MKKQFSKMRRGVHSLFLYFLYPITLFPIPLSFQTENLSTISGTKLFQMQFTRCPNQAIVCHVEFGDQFNKFQLCLDQADLP